MHVYYEYAQTLHDRKISAALIEWIVHKETRPFLTFSDIGGRSHRHRVAPQSNMWLKHAFIIIHYTYTHSGRKWMEYRGTKRRLATATTTATAATSAAPHTFFICQPTDDSTPYCWECVQRARCLLDRLHGNGSVYMCHICTRTHHVTGFACTVRSVPIDDELTTAFWLKFGCQRGIRRVSSSDLRSLICTTRNVEAAEEFDQFLLMNNLNSNQCRDRTSISWQPICG